jgi:diguanylate cyclase (GGDEF)-like protein
MQFRVQHLQGTGAAFVALVCLAMAVIATAPRLSDYAKSRRTMSEFSELSAVLEAAAAFSAERGPANRAMTTANDAPEFREALAAARVRTDADLKALAPLLAPGVASVELQTAFAAVRAQLAKARAMVDAVAAAPEHPRNSAEIAAAIMAMFEAYDRMQDVRDIVSRKVIELAPAAGVDVILATSASALRERAGRAGSYVVMALTAGSSARSAYLAAYANELTRVTDLYAILKTYEPTMADNADVSRALAAVGSDYFLGSLAYANDVVTGLEGGRAPSFRDFSVGYVPGMRATETLRSVILSGAEGGLAVAQQDALRTVMISFALAATEIAAMIGLAWIVRYALFRPLLLVKRQIAEIADGNLRSPQIVQAGGVEVREMLQGLAVLRNQLRLKSKLEAERAAMADELKRQSNTDALTGLLNRRALGEIVSGLFTAPERQGAGLGVLMFDVDHFKSINDQYGHAVGDRVLKRIAALLAPKLRVGDAFARYGGEEFIIILHNVSEAETLFTAERLRACLDHVGAFDEHFGFGRLDKVTASFGVAWRAPSGAADWDEVVHVADERLYLAKRSGRNRVCAGASDPPGAGSVVALQAELAARFDRRASRSA